MSYKLENYKELEKGQTFKDMTEARKVINFYAIANRKCLRVKKKVILLGPHISGKMNDPLTISYQKMGGVTPLESKP